MSLQVDGVWKAAVWVPTAWAEGVWFESDGSVTPPPVINSGELFVPDVSVMARQRKRKPLKHMLLLIG